MDQRFEAFIAAAVQNAKAERSLLWADQIAERIASSTPLLVRKADISEQISREAARMGVAVTVVERTKSLRSACCGSAPA